MNTIIEKLFSVVLVMLLATELVNSEKTVDFNYTNFTTDSTSSLTFQGSAKLESSYGVLDLTKPSVTETVGRVLYKTPVPLWDNTTGNVASFLTTFTFSMIDIVAKTPSDGIIFFLAPNTVMPTNSSGGKLGVVSENNAYNQFVGVEFDNVKNNWDPDYTHFGIDVGSLKSLKYSKWKRVHHASVYVTIIYDSQSHTLSVALKDLYGQFATVAQVVDLRDVLPQTVWVGFSAAGQGQLHYIRSWSFRSSLKTTTTSTSTSFENISSS